VRIPGFFLNKRPIGAPNVVSIFNWDSDGSDRGFVETATTLHARADFTDDVSAMIQIYDYSVWGEDFRSDWVTGLDGRATRFPTGNLEIHQAYIDIDGVFDLPLKLRIGRQELKYGKGWLVSNMLTPTQRLSFDGVRAIYDMEPLTLDGFYAKLDERFSAEQDGDTDFMGLYATYDGWEALSLSGYWFWLRDAQSLNDTNLFWGAELIENILGVDDYGVSNLHTVGVRANGKSGPWDYDLEVAYQFGDAHAHGFLFKSIGGVYGDDDAEYDNWAAEFFAGYTFEDATWEPRLGIQAAYYEGEDNRDITLGEWLNPFYLPEASVSFNRLFTDRNYMPVVNDNGWLSNFWELAVMCDLQITDKIRWHGQLAHAWVVEPFDYPATFELGDWRIPIAPNLSFWTEEVDDELGWEASFWVRYDYSDDLYFLVYYNHLFVGDGLASGSYNQFNGLGFSGGSDDDDADYLFGMTVIKF
jgi:hypothetical protein